MFSIDDINWSQNENSIFSKATFCKIEHVHVHTYVQLFIITMHFGQIFDISINDSIHTCTYMHVLNGRETYD